MATVSLNAVINHFRGRVGDLVFKRYGDRTVVTNRPERRDLEPSPAQKSQQERFRKAVAYAKWVRLDATASEFYEQAAKATGKRAYVLAIADFLNAPEVKEVDASAYAGTVGDAIVVHAHDDVGVQTVRVVLTRADGGEIEEGEAVASEVESGRWDYRAEGSVPGGTRVRIRATAIDYAGVAGSAEVEALVPGSPSQAGRDHPGSPTNDVDGMQTMMHDQPLIARPGPAAAAESRRNAMANMTIRNLDGSIQRKLRNRAADHGRSVEEEVREILCTALSQEDASSDR